MINAIVACDAFGGISKDGVMPWPKNSADMAHFKQHTIGQMVIMGSKTWHDKQMPSPLPNRYNIVITSQELEGPALTISGKLHEKIPEIPFNEDATKKWIIGGADVIEQCLPIIDEFYLTRIPGNYDCDTFIPLSKIDLRFKLADERWAENTNFQRLIKRW
jgi:dihydrofolate reductase